MKKPEVTSRRLLDALHEAEPERPVVRSTQLIRPATFEGRRGGEKRWFTKQRQKNRAANKAARKARKR